MDSFLDRLLAEGESAQPSPAASSVDDAPQTGEKAASLAHLEAPAGAAAPRIAIYDTLTTPPRVIAVEEGDLPALIASLAEKTYSHCRNQGGQVPYTVIQELIENLLHAYFKDVVITILDGGQTIRISDHGPGVEDKERAFKPGFTTATAQQREFIRGVGSGLPVARESLQFLNGVLTVEDNLGGGAVFTIKLPRQQQAAPQPAPVETYQLTSRQKKLLFLLMELGSSGPTILAKELNVSPATAFRELVILQDMGLIHALGDGKRELAEEGLRQLENLL